MNFFFPASALRPRLSGLGLTLMALASLTVAPALAGPTVYVDDTSGRLAQLDVATGNSTIVGNLPTDMTDIAFSPTGQLYAVDFGSNLWKINAANATGTDIGRVGSFVNALVFGKDGTLYAAGGNALFTLNTSTGAGTEVGSFGNYSSSGDLAFDPSGNLLLSANSFSSSDDLLRLNTQTGAGTLIGPFGFRDVYGLALGPNGVLYGMSANTATEDVFTINEATGAGTFLSNYGGHSLSSIGGSSFFSEASPVPEASTTISFGLMLALGLGGLVVAARRKKIAG